MKPSAGEKLFYACNYMILAILGISCVLPLLHIAALSLSDSTSIMSGSVYLWPQGATLLNYSTLIKSSQVPGALWNSTVITVAGVAFSMIGTILAAWPLSRSYCYARRPITMAIVFTMLFSGGMIPTYLVVKELGILNSYWALWLPGLVSVYNLLIMRTFFANIPEELIESGRLDGCGEARLLLRIALPLSKPMLATLSLFYGVHYWNAFMNVLIYINKTHLYNLTVLVQQMVKSQQLMQEMEASGLDTAAAYLAPEGLKAASIFVLVIPMMLVYPFLQKYFVKGVMLGAVKG